MAGPHRRRVDAVCPIKVCIEFGQVLHGDEAVDGGGRADCAFFRELAGRTVNPVLFEQLARLCHRTARGTCHRWRHGEVGIRRVTAESPEWFNRHEAFKANVGADSWAGAVWCLLNLRRYRQGRQGPSYRVRELCAPFSGPGVT